MNKGKKNIICIISAMLLLITISFSGCVFPFGNNIYEYINEEFEADENTILKVNNINGEVRVIGTDNQTISVRIIKITKKIWGEEELQNAVVDFNQNNNELSIETRYLKDNTHVVVSMYIDVPRYVRVEKINTINGGVYIYDVRGFNSIFSTTNGQVNIEKVTEIGEHIHAKTINGPVNIKEITFSQGKGDVFVQTTSGPVEIDDVRGFVEAKVMNGPITITDVDGVHDVTSISGVIDVEIANINRDIDISLVNGEINLYLNIDMDINLDIEINPPTSGFRLNEFYEILEFTRFDSDHIEAILGDGGHLIKMDITVGFINIYKLNI